MTHAHYGAAAGAPPAGCLLVADADAGGYTATTAATGSSGTVVQVGSSGGLVFSITFDGSVGSAPSGFVAAFEDAAAFYAGQFTNPVTVNLDVGWGEIDGQAISSTALGESETYIDADSYSQLKTALAAGAGSSDDSMGQGQNAIEVASSRQRGSRHRARCRPICLRTSSPLSSDQAANLSSRWPSHLYRAPGLDLRRLKPNGLRQCGRQLFESVGVRLLPDVAAVQRAAAIE